MVASLSKGDQIITPIKKKLYEWIFHKQLVLLMLIDTDSEGNHTRLTSSVIFTVIVVRRCHQITWCRELWKNFFHIGIRQLWDWSDLYEELPNLLVKIGVDTKKLSPTALISEKSAEPEPGQSRFQNVFECLKTVFSKMSPTRATDVIDGKDPRRPTDHVLEIFTSKILNFMFPLEFSPPESDTRILIPEIACCKCSENVAKGKFCTT